MCHKGKSDHLSQIKKVLKKLTCEQAHQPQTSFLSLALQHHTLEPVPKPGADSQSP